MLLLLSIVDDKKEDQLIILRGPDSSTCNEDVCDLLLKSFFGTHTNTQQEEEDVSFGTLKTSLMILRQTFWKHYDINTNHISRFSFLH